MSDAVLQTIGILETELEATHQRAGELQRLIDGLRGLTGDAPATTKKASATPRAARPAARPSEDVEKLSAVGDRIVAALRVKSPQKPGELLRTAKLKFHSRSAYLFAVGKLVAAGRIVREGTGRGAIVRLPGKSPARSGAKEGL